ncbi:hypothetical protein ACFWCB_32255 [Streptomyces sp. NPDC060048]|uniref:hypothetical protein n=1 Tax=unclassified Streptomyces TaxID=2593676 RepID=UPI0036B78595
MTNRHVAAGFTRSDGNSGWVFRSGMTARVDTTEELQLAGAAPGDGSFEYEVTEVLGIHREADMASRYRCGRRSLRRHLLMDPEPLYANASPASLRPPRALRTRRSPRRG